MSSYTSLLQTPFDSISPEDEGFIDELLGVAELFRPFSAAMDEFLLEQGFSGDILDIDAKTGFISGAFERSAMKPPRELRLWFSEDQPIERDTAFQLCFAFGLDGTKTDEFFRHVLVGERSFDCHRVQEAIWYFCLNNGLTWADAQDILSRIPSPEGSEEETTVVYTGSILRELNRIGDRNELIRYLTDNVSHFNTNNATAYQMIRNRWNDLSRKGGWLEREYDRFLPLSKDPLSGGSGILKTGPEGVRLWDAYLAIFQLDKKQVSRLAADRSIRPILDRFHLAVGDSFPDRQGISLILQGKHVSYKRVRKWLILLLFYIWWVRRALDRSGYTAEGPDPERFLAFANKALTDAGYPELYIGDPYDWLFLYISQDLEPLRLFREVFNSLLGEKLEEHP